MRIVGEVVRSLDRVGRQFPDLQLEALFVDAGPDTEAYLETFKQELRIPGEVLTPYAALSEEVAPLFFEQRLNPLAGVALSYALGVGNVNLLEVDAQPEESGLTFQRIVASAVVAAFLTGGVGGYMSWSNGQEQTVHTAALAAHQAEIEGINKKIQMKSAPGESIEALQNTLQSYAIIENFLNSQGGRGETPFSQWMETLAQSIPDGLWLTSIEFGNLSSGTLSLAGVAKSNENLATWIETLNKTTSLAGNYKFDVLDIKQNPDTGSWVFVVKSQGAKK